MSRKLFLPLLNGVWTVGIAFLCAPPLYAEKISFSAGSMKGVVGDKSDTTELSGDAYVLTESMEISADSIKMSGKDFRFIEASGAVKGKNSEAELEFECGMLKYDRETKVAELFNSVSLTDVKNDVTATAQMIEYNQTSDVAVMQMEIELKQKDNICNGAYAVYRKKDQMLELSGNAQIKQGEDSFRAQEITLNLDSQEITLDGRVKGSIVDERKTENQDGEGEQVEGDATENAGGEDESAAASNGQSGTADAAAGETKIETPAAKDNAARKPETETTADADKQTGGKELSPAAAEKAAASDAAASKSRKTAPKSKRGKK
ncbi:MAG: LptA/OstA family protein [Treponema sp.]